MKKRSFKKILATLLTACLVLTGTAIAANAATTITQFVDGNFTSNSPAELIYLQEDCDVVTFVGHCQGDEVDLVSCHIVDRSHGGIYTASFDFYADGSATLFENAFPAGEYRIYFTGSSDILKTRVVADFAQADYI